MLLLLYWIVPSHSILLVILICTAIFCLRLIVYMSTWWYIVHIADCKCDFYARPLYRHVLLRARISYGDSVSPPVCHWFKTSWDIYSASSPYDILQCPLSNDVIWCHWVRRLPSNNGIKQGYRIGNRHFTTIGSSNVKTVADRHRLAAYHNKHCRRAFQWYQHRWPWTTFNPKIGVFSEILAISGCNTQFKTKLHKNHSR